MDALRFINALRIMWNLDRHHLVEAGVLDADDQHGWEVFRDYPHDAAIRLSDERAARLWTLVESRQPKADDKAELSASVRDAAPDMLAALRKALDDWPQFDAESAPLAPGCIPDEVEPVNGGDLVEWFAQWRETAKAVFAKAEGRANG